MCYCDFDPNKVDHDERVKARNEYECAECGRKIAKGETYEKHTMLSRDGGWSSYRWCLHCAVARPIASDLADCHCWFFTQLWDGLREHAQDERDMQLIRLVKGADRGWTYQRGPHKGQLVPLPAAKPVPAKV